MTTVTYPNGVTLYWDETLQIGDLVTGYRSGIWRIYRIESRPDHTPLMYMTRMLNDKYFKCSRIKGSCDASYVRRWNRDAALQNIEEMRANILMVGRTTI